MVLPKNDFKTQGGRGESRARITSLSDCGFGSQNNLVLLKIVIFDNFFAIVLRISIHDSCHVKIMGEWGMAKKHFESQEERGGV